MAFERDYIMVNGDPITLAKYAKNQYQVEVHGYLSKKLAGDLATSNIKIE